jgi:hypothetical protein
VRRVHCSTPGYQRLSVTKASKHPHARAGPAACSIDLLPCMKVKEGARKGPTAFRSASIVSLTIRASAQCG